MRNLGLAACVALEFLAACTPSPLDLDFGSDERADAGGGEGAFDGGTRILSDALPPGRVDASSSRDADGGAVTRDAGTESFEDRASYEDAATVDIAFDAASTGDAKVSDASAVPEDAAGGRDGRSDGAHPDASVVMDATMGIDSRSENDVVRSQDGGDERDAGMVLGTCNAVRACVRTDVDGGEGCLREATSAARSAAEPVLSCESTACASACGSANTLAECNACLVPACFSALVACAKQSGCGDGVVTTETEECDDGNTDDHDACNQACARARCGDGLLWNGQEACDDGNDDRFDSCGDCVPPAAHLLVTEVVTRPAGAEMIEIMNPTQSAVLLADYALSDSHLYFEVTTGAFTTASGSDFAARFPDGAMLEPGHYAVVALGNASGGSQSFAAIYGKAPDFELRPTANQATDDATVPNMVPMGVASIGANTSLTDSGEPIVLFFYNGGDHVYDVDYVFYGAPTAGNPMIDKTGIVRGAWSYLADTPAAAQHAVAAPGDAGSIHRCVYAESQETTSLGNGIAGHDETSEDASVAFRLGSAAGDRTPGGPPAAALCAK